MTVHSLAQALADSTAVVALANKTGVSVSAVRRLLAELAEMEAQQMVRLCATAHADRIRQTNRTTRRSEPRE